MVCQGKENTKISHAWGLPENTVGGIESLCSGPAVDTLHCRVYCWRAVYVYCLSSDGGGVWIAVCDV